MKALLDTNIIIHREASKIINQDVGILYRWLDRGGYTKCIHSLTIKEIETYQDKQIVDTFHIKLSSYERVDIPSPLQETVVAVSTKFDVNQNDKNDTQLLNEVFVGRVDILITEDKKIRKKAIELGVDDKVFTIDSFLEKVIAEHPELVNYKVLNVQKVKFGQINLDEEAYVTINADKGLLLSFLYLKVEDEKENYKDITPLFPPKKRLKVGTFKVISNGFRIGERFMKIIFDNALVNKVNEIYVTIFDKRDEQRRLIDLLEQWGFTLWGKKNEELVYVRDFSKGIDFGNLKYTYPYISKSRDCFIVPIHPEYHTELLPDSILNNESPEDFIEDFPHRNAISKVYVSGAMLPHPNKGDLLIFYRTGGHYISVVTTIGVVEEVKYNFLDEEDFVLYCRKSSIFPEEELRKRWRKSYKKPFTVRFLYIYSFPRRINMDKLIELKILAGVSDPPRGFRKITQEQLNTILKETRSDESFIVD